MRTARRAMTMMRLRHAGSTPSRAHDLNSLRAVDGSECSPSMSTMYLPGGAGSTTYKIRGSAIVQAPMKVAGPFASIECEPLSLS